MSYPFIRPMNVPTVSLGAALRWGFYWLQACLLGLALLLCLQGRGRLPFWLLMGIALPVFHWLASPSYRRHVQSWLNRWWEDCRSYPTRGGPAPGLAAFALVVVPSAMLFLSNGATQGSGDTWPVILTACSLVTERNWDLDEYFLQAPAGSTVEEEQELPYYVVRHGNRIYSRYPAGMLQFGLPVVLTSRLLGAELDSPKVRGRLEKWTAAWLAAGCLGLFFLLALHLVEPAIAALVTFQLAIGSVFISTTGQGLWQQGGVIWWSLVILLVEFRREHHPVPAGTWLQGIACGMMLACRLTAVVFLVPLGCWVLLRSPRRGLAVAFIGLLSFIPWALLYLAIYGTPFGPSTGLLASTNWSHSPWTALAGVLFSPARGLLVYQPWLLVFLALCVPACRRMPAAPGRGQCPFGWTWFCGAVIVLQLILVTQWNIWWGGYSWGSRLLAELVPLLALGALWPVQYLWSHRSGRAILAVLTVSAILVHAPSVFQKAYTWNERVEVDSHTDQLWSWSRPPFLFPWQQ